MTAYVPALINILAFFVGQVLVTRRHWAGFLVWAVSNLFVVAACVVKRDAPTALMFVVYLAANVYSMLRWAGVSRRRGGSVRLKATASS